MNVNSVKVPFPIFNDVDGDPLDAGYIYVGTKNLDPETNPIAVYSDSALTVPVTQPIRTTNGYPSLAGTPINIYVAVDDYSVTVKDKNQSLIYTALKSSERLSRATLGSIAVGVFDTKTDLIASSPDAGIIVRTTGYSTINDGGHGVYAIVTAAFGGTPDEIGGAFTLANGNVAVLQSENGAVNSAQFGMDGSTDDKQVNLKAFIDYGAANGGFLKIVSPVRTTPVTLTSNAKPFSIWFADDDVVISANSKATPLNFNSCTGITFVHPNIDGRANEQGALLEADGIYHGMVWLDCTDMCAYKPRIENYNGTAILAYKSVSGPVRNFMLDGRADGRGEGENRNGFLLVDAVDSEIINCQATGFAAFGLELKNECVNCAIRGGKVDNTAIATGCGQVGATAPGVGGVRDSVIEGVIVENCDQAYAGAYSRNVHVDLPVVDLRVLPGLVLADFGFRLTECEESTVRFRHFMGDVEVGQFWTNSKKNAAVVDFMESESSTFVNFIAGSEDNSIEIKRATKDVAGTVTEYDFLRDRVTDNGANNTFKYTGGDSRKSNGELIRYVSSTSVTIDGATSTANQDIINPIFPIRAGEFIQEGDEIVLEVSGEFVGAGTNKRLFVYFGGSLIAFVVSGIATTQPFEFQVRIASRGPSSQYWMSKLSINGQTMDVEKGTSSVAISAGADLILQGKLDAGAGNTITVDRCVAKIINKRT